MKFTILTLFPKIFDSYFGESILKRAIQNKKIEVHAIDIRAFTKDKHKTARPTERRQSFGRADHKPYGGGAGMVLAAEPILKAYDSVAQKRKKTKVKTVVLSAKGKLFNQRIASQWAQKYSEIVFIAGRYEGIDERVKKILGAEEISIGPYVLTDGDVAVMTIISAVARLVPGVIRLESLTEESHWNLLLKKESGEMKKGLEYPHYTRPEVLVYKQKKYTVPRVLLSGDHAKIETWRKKHRK